MADWRKGKLCKGECFSTNLNILDGAEFQRLTDHCSDGFCRVRMHPIVHKNADEEHRRSETVLGIVVLLESTVKKGLLALLQEVVDALVVLCILHVRMGRLGLVRCGVQRHMGAQWIAIILMNENQAQSEA